MEPLRDEALARRLVETYSDQLLRLGYSLLNSIPDAQDVCQEVLLKRLAHGDSFESPEHERAWLIRVTVNQCKNLRRSLFRRSAVSLEDAPEPAGEFRPEEGGVLEEIQRLPTRDRQVLVLYYYEGYDTGEIGALLGLRPDAVRARMKRARDRLKGRLEELGYGTLS